MSNLLALASSLVWGVSDYVGGVVTRGSPVVVVVFGSHLVGLTVGLIGAPLFGGGLTPSTVGWGMAAGLAGGVGLVALYQGLASGQMAVVAPIASVVGAGIPVVAGLMIGERPSALAMIGAVMALPALWLVARPPGPRQSGLVRNSAALLGVAAGVGFGTFFVSLSQTPEDAGLWPLVPARIASVVVMGSLLVAGRGRGAVERTAVPGIVCAGAGDMLSNMLFLAAVQRGFLATVSVLASLYPVFTVATARLLGEPVSSGQWMGIGLSVLAVGLITV